MLVELSTFHGLETAGGGAYLAEGICGHEDMPYAAACLYQLHPFDEQGFILKGGIQAQKTGGSADSGVTVATQELTRNP